MQRTGRTWYGSLVGRASAAEHIKLVGCNRLGALGSPLRPSNLYVDRKQFRGSSQSPRETWGARKEPICSVAGTVLLLQQTTAATARTTTAVCIAMLCLSPPQSTDCPAFNPTKDTKYEIRTIHKGEQWHNCRGLIILGI